MMILIADSGSTKTDWGFVKDGRVVCQCRTQGINPFFLSEQEILTILSEELASCATPVDQVEECFFYGSGCREELKPKLISALSAFFPVVQHVEVQNDLLGAARALFGCEAGIACILGTGSNSCFYDGHLIRANIPPLGYVLGDEGSGAVMGKCFLNAIFKHPEYAELRDIFLQQTHMSLSDILQKVYSSPLPNRFLATIPPFLSSHISYPLIEQFVCSCFSDFVEYNIYHYHTASSIPPIGAVGSIAFHFEKQLRKVIETDYGFSLCKVLKDPLEGLITFHCP